MAFDLRRPPSLQRGYELADAMEDGLAGQGRAKDLRLLLNGVQEWMRQMAGLEEREFAPQLLVDLYEMFSALKGARIEGVVRLLIVPPGDNLPGQYSVTTEFGKLTGEAAQLANTITLLGRATAQRPVEPPAPPEEEHWESPDEEPGELSRSIY